MAHSYDEIRSKAIEVLRSGHYRGHFSRFLQSVDDAYAKEHSRQPRLTARYGTVEELSEAEKTLLLEVFWDLFREGVITLGINEDNPGFPWFHVSERGKKQLDNIQ